MATTPTVPPTVASTTTSTAPASLALRPDGLDASTFGDAAAPVIAAATALFGAPTTDSVNQECGAGPLRLVNWAQLRLVFRPEGGPFAGYLWQAQAPAAATGTGVRVGSTVVELRAAYPTVNVRSDSLGPEWTVMLGSPQRFLAGFLTATEPGGTVTRIYAGTTCFFR